MTDLPSCSAKYQAARTAFLAHDRLALTPGLGPEHGKLLANLSRQQTLAVKKWTITCQQVTDIEGHLDIPLGGRWSPDHPCRKAVAEFMNQRDYHQALDDVERLVVMRLFELTKLNQSGTGTSYIFFQMCLAHIMFY